MDENRECPDQKVLLDFVARRLDEATHRQVEAHRDACKRCSEAVAWIIANLVKEEEDELEGGSSATESFPSHLAAQLQTEAGANLDEESFDVNLLAPSSKKDSIGRLGKYDVNGVIGQGGMGVVFQAFDEQLRRTVAIKVLNRRLASSAVARRRFIREARAAAGIKHANVITIYAVEESQNCPFLVMEYVGGCSLREHIRRHRRLEPMEVVRLSQGIAAGLAAAHAQGVIHRDIKPSNIMLEEGGVRVKITDFGLARAAVDKVDLTSQGAAVGTAAYMSPEQVSGNAIDLRSDLFSLGCVMYAMVTGHSPFQGKNSLDIARKVAEYNPPPLEKTHEGTPPMLSEIVARLLEKDPEKRFQSATEVAEVLNRYLAILNQTPTDEMSRVLRASRLPRPSRRRWLRWVFPAAAVVLIAALGALLLWPRGHEDPGATSGGGQVKSDTAGQVPTSSLTVDRSPEADAGSIGEALLRAERGTVIRVTAGKPYVEAVEISGARLCGVWLEGQIGPDGARPVLQVNDDAAPVIRIRDVSGVVVRGFRIETGLPEETRVPSAIAIEGRASGITIKDVEYHQPDAADVEPAVRIDAIRQSERDEPIVLRDCTIESPASGQCVRITGSAQGGQEVQLKGNRFSGRGTLVLCRSEEGASLGDLTIEGNFFLGRREEVEGRFERSAMNGVNLDLVSPVPDRLVRINNNTFLDVRFWLGLVRSKPERMNAAVCNNLILGSDGVEIGSEGQGEKAATWRWESNWREPIAETNVEPSSAAGASTAARIQRVTFVHGTKEQSRLVTTPDTVKEPIELLRRDDPSRDDFLVPPPGSPLFTSGFGQEGLPSYLGARGPQESGQR